MKTVLITGIDGFLGSHLAKTLKKDYRIIGLEHSLENLSRVSSDEFQIYSSDDELKDIFNSNQIFCIIHAATVYRHKQTPIENVINTNILLPVKLYELANSNGVDLFINTDSFFNNPKYNYSYLPDYTLSKKQVNEWLNLLKANCTLVNMKIFHMYGPEDNPNKFISKLINDLKQGQEILEFTSGIQKRDFIFIDDVVAAYKSVLQNYKILNDQNSNLDIGTGITTSLREFIEICQKYYSPETELDFGKLEQRENEILYSCADITLMQSLNWKPQFSIQEGIKRL